MSIGDIKFTREEVQPIVEAIINLLSPHCLRLEVAGSYRRERNEIGDIEIVCVPKTVPFPDGLFETKDERVNGFVETIEAWEKVKGDPREGKYTQRIYQYGGACEIKVDIFICRLDNWGIVLLTRTGPWEYSKQVLGTDMKKKGYKCEGGYVWKDGEKVPTLEENDVYALLGTPPIPPVARI